MTDKFSIHEVLHMASFLMENWDSEVLQRVIDEMDCYSDEDKRLLVVLSDNAFQNMFQFYQKLGALHLIEDEDEKS